MSLTRADSEGLAHGRPEGRNLKAIPVDKNSFSSQTNLKFLGRIIEFFSTSELHAEI